jgi:hypothetical protein
LTTETKRPKAGVKSSKLKGVHPSQTQPSKPKVVLFGKYGVGKTWTALKFPKVYYIDVEGGADLAHYMKLLEESGGVYVGPEQGSRDLDSVIEQVEGLATEDHPYQTLVIDSLTKLLAIEVRKEREAIIKATGKEPAYGAEKKPMMSKLRKLLDWIHPRLDMNTFLICYEKDEYNEGEKTGKTADVPLEALHDIHLILQVKQLSRDKRQAVPLKSRLAAFPQLQPFEWSYDEFGKRIGFDTINRAVELFVSCTPEQQQRFEYLLEMINSAEKESRKAKAFRGVNADDYSQVSSSMIDAWIAKLEAEFRAKASSIN